MPSYICSPLSAVEDIGPWCLGERPQPSAAELCWRWLLRAAAVGEPRRQVRPPASPMGLRGLQPVGRRGRVGLAGLVGGFRVVWRIDERGYVAAGGQDEAALAAEQLGAAVAVLPRGDVVG